MTNLIIRENSPENFETDFAQLKGPISPNDQFYIRNHFSTPAINAKDWRLRIEGEVLHELELNYETLLAMPQHVKTVTLECAGNGRVFLTPKADGVQWQLGAVGTAEWTGVLLSDVLERVGIKANAVDVVLQGSDSGTSSKPSRPADVFPFARSIPIDTARNGDVLLAYKMNGEDLPRAHGYPLRAIVPGWYGMASVKWLSRIVVSSQAFQGYFQTVDYAYWQVRNGLPIRTPITELQVKSQIAKPTFREQIRAGASYRIFGAAWSGQSLVSKVEVSTDGKSFSTAKLLGDPIKHAWRLWEFTWRVPTEPGIYAVSARATDQAGNIQPVERDRNRENYMINHVMPLEVIVA